MKEGKVGKTHPRSMPKPTTPIRLTPMLQYPRMCVRSANQPTEMVSTAAQAYGGTVNSCAMVVLVYPMPVIIVGRNKLNAYSGISQPM